MIIIKLRSFSNGVPHFVLKIKENVNLDVFHEGPRTHIQRLAKNHFHKLKSRSALTEVLRLLREPHEDHMNAVIEQQLSSIPKFAAYKI